MKKFYLFFLTVFFVFSATAQIPNAGFETWTNDTTPVSWNGAMSVTVMGFYNFDLATVEKSTDAHNGTYAAMLTSDRTIPIVGTLLPGILSYGKNVYDILSGIQVSGGIPVTVKPLKIKGYYKYANVNNDTMGIMGICYKSGDTIATGGLMSASTVSSYTYFEFDLDYTQSLMPDTFNIIAVSSAGAAAQTGSALYLDDIEVVITGAGFEETISVDDLVKLSPNPTQGLLTVELMPNETNFITVYDFSGKPVLAQQPVINRTKLDMSAFSNGVYFIEIINSNGRYTKKLVVAK
ncbi:MAG TPA: T9SS type A sorting domain-containing protein [Bacteroidales bacterium]|nr:T9SS type A sorting domain-containing protein [Bacteroidales bacterium]HNZ42809.1 T9SS type A sorting domain-containing protein [Bacteroidales bacterium]HOH83406.1 T9SS type A sorting domain-containing protein [Bacteroidales bacterium]HPB26288.1 T9SS type A sorting domain-containing protein [Bacteroidales bacterium]HPI29379.1 T9SS type A sorting domain-containing protein [Bacteroidales bacterium]